MMNIAISLLHSAKLKALTTLLIITHQLDLSAALLAQQAKTGTTVVFENVIGEWDVPGGTATDYGDMKAGL